MPPEFEPRYYEIRVRGPGSDDGWELVERMKHENDTYPVVNYVRKEYPGQRIKVVEVKTEWDHERGEDGEVTETVLFEH